jgi:hypothetical protein
MDFVERERGDCLHIFAAGNSDTSRRGRPDMDPDPNLPQAELSDRDGFLVVGACDHNGVPTLFSSDSGGAHCMAPGLHLPLWHPFGGAVAIVSGTSFSAPLTLGLMAREGLRNKEEALEYVEREGRVARGWTGLGLHRKAGRGSLHRQIRGFVPQQVSQVLTLDYEVDE